MRKSLLQAVILSFLLVSTSVALEPGDTLWTRTYGGSRSDYGYDVQETMDGGYIVAGQTYSFGAGSSDFYLIKTDAEGTVLWSRTYGGSAWDYAKFVQPTNDGGYIVIGSTMSFGAGETDVYIVKTDADGDTLWTRVYGGQEWDRGYCVRQMDDGNYIVAADARSFGDPNDYDAWILKLDTNGDTLWTRLYGEQGSYRHDGVLSIQQTPDGGFIAAGWTRSYGPGGADFYLLKTDANGAELWHSAYGTGVDEEAQCVKQTSDGGYILAGLSFEEWEQPYDAYLVKTDSLGDTLWTRMFDWGGGEGFYCVGETPDGGYIVAGFTDSFGAGGGDCYLVKTDLNGDTLWTRTYGGSASDSGYCVQQTSEGGFILAGVTRSFGAGACDVYLVKVAGQALPAVSIEIVPDDPPVCVPQGGSFGFTGTLTNNTEEAQVIDAWTMVIGPEKEIYGPFKVRYDIQLAPGQGRSAHFNQHVPGGAPLGFYNYIAYCGDYSSTVMDSSYFQVEVIAGPAGGATGWVLTGSFLEGEDLADLPSEFALSGNYPNPFNASTMISYELPTTSGVKLEIYNISGQKVATLVDSRQQAGYKSVVWDATEVSSGVYFYKLTAGDFTEMKRMTLLR